MTLVEQVKGYVSERLSEHTTINGYTGDLELSPHLQDCFERNSLKEAAVLILLTVQKSGVSILLTKRADHLRDHPGEWSFPGGKKDESDADNAQTALRETHEEVGAQINNIDIIGQLPDYHARKGFNITPVIGIATSSMRYNINTDEVSEIIDIPLSHLHDPRSQRIFQENFNGHAINLRGLVYGDRKISGATAGMLINFTRLIVPANQKINRGPPLMMCNS